MTQQFDLLKASAVTQIQQDLEAAVQADRILAETARSDAQTARTGSESAKGLSEAARDASQSARDDSQTARDKAQEWADADEGVPVESAPDRFSAKHWAAQSQILASLSPSLATQIGTLAAVLGQNARRLDGLEVTQGDTAALTGVALELAAIIGQISGQVNGGRATLAGGNLADPALRIGSVGVYSSAANTLSIAIAGSEVARFTASGLTVFGTVTEA